MDSQDTSREKSYKRGMGRKKKKKKGDSIRQGGFLSMVMKQGDNNIYVPRPALRDLEIGSPQIYPLLEEQRTESKKKRIEKNEK